MTLSGMFISIVHGLSLDWIYYLSRLASLLTSKLLERTKEIGEDPPKSAYNNIFTEPLTETRLTGLRKTGDADVAQVRKQTQCEIGSRRSLRCRVGHDSAFRRAQTADVSVKAGIFGLDESQWVSLKVYRRGVVCFLEDADDARSARFLAVSLRPKIAREAASIVGDLSAARHRFPPLSWPASQSVSQSVRFTDVPSGFSSAGSLVS